MLNITHHDTRGTEDVPFGFVYFNDNSRVIYANGKVRIYQGPYWEPARFTHVNKAIQYLKKQFPKIVWKEYKEEV